MNRQKRNRRRVLAAKKAVLADQRDDRLVSWMVDFVGLATCFVRHGFPFTAAMDRAMANAAPRGGT